MTVESCFLNFVAGASSRLQEVVDAAQSLSDNGNGGNELSSLLERVSSQGILNSEISLRDVLGGLARLRIEVDAVDLEEFNASMIKFVLFTTTHEVHLLFGALRAPDVSSHFILNICKLNYRSWRDFAGNTVLFGAVLKLAWGRFLSKGHCSMGKDHNALKEFLCGSLKSPDLKSFTDHFQGVHFEPVRFYSRFLLILTVLVALFFRRFLV